MLRVCAAFLLLLLAGCGGMSLEDFEGTQPVFVPEDYFQGRFRVYGMFLDRFGNVRRQFRADVDGYLEGEVLVLDEHFEFQDGETQERTWRIRKVGPGRYQGEAADIVGVATGVVAGQALHMSYDIELPSGDATWQVHFEDWLLLQPDGVILNRATVTKYGVEVGEMIAFFERTAAPAPASAPPA